MTLLAFSNAELAIGRCEPGEVRVGDWKGDLNKEHDDGFDT